jgi:anti-sigma B factor antagonist
MAWAVAPAIWHFGRINEPLNAAVACAPSGRLVACVGRAKAGSRPMTSAPFPLPELTVIASEGEIDVSSVGAFRNALSEATRAGVDRLVIDLSEVSFIDSSGLGALLEAHNRLRRDKRQLVVVAPSGTAAAVLLELAGLRGRLSIAETREGAIAMQ